jgi:hypothetical protein
MKAFSRFRGDRFGDVTFNLRPEKLQHLVPSDGCVHVVAKACWCEPVGLDGAPWIMMHAPHPGWRGGSMVLR